MIKKRFKLSKKLLFFIIILIGTLAGTFVFNKDTTSLAANSNYKFDFGGNGTASGYTGVSANTSYSSSRGYGFNTPSKMKNVSATGSGVLSDAVQFVTSGASSNNTFNVDLPTGLYQITVTLGNTTRTSIAAEGMLQLINLTGNNATETFQLPVTDGQLNILATAGKDGYAFTMSSLEITQISTNPTMKQTIWLCGDSTVCNYYPKNTAYRVGWGQMLPNYIDKNAFEVRNMAASGQYAKGFVDAGQFKAIETYGKKGDYYIISIGINDGTYSNATEYYETITYMTKRAKAKGMTVILVKQQGRASDVTNHPTLTGRWYGTTLDKIGSEQNVDVLDLFNLSFTYFKSIGQTATTALYDDALHPNREGAKVLANLVANNITFTKLTNNSNFSGTASPTSSTNTSSWSNANWNFSNSAFNLLGTISSNKTVSNLTLHATENKTLKVASKTASYNGTTYNYYLGLGGAGNTSYRSISFNVTGKCTINVVGNSSGSSTRILAISDANGNQLGTISAPSSISGGAFNYNGNSQTLYLYSTGSGINLYNVSITY